MRFDILLRLYFLLDLYVPLKKPAHATEISKKCIKIVSEISIDAFVSALNLEQAMHDCLHFCGRTHRGRLLPPPPLPPHLLDEVVGRSDDPPDTSGDGVSSGNWEMTSTDQCRRYPGKLHPVVMSRHQRGTLQGPWSSQSARAFAEEPPLHH